MKHCKTIHQTLSGQNDVLDKLSKRSAKQGAILEEIVDLLQSAKDREEKSREEAKKHQEELQKKYTMDLKLIDIILAYREYRDLLIGNMKPDMKTA